MLNAILVSIVLASGGPVDAAEPLRAPSETVEVPSMLIRIDEQVEAPAREPGVLAAVNVREGQIIEQGASIAQIEDDEARIAATRAKIEMEIAQDGRKRFRGILTGVEGDAAKLRRKDAAEGEPADVLLPIAEMAEARLVLTDELIRESLRKEKAGRERHADNDNRLPANAAHANGNEGE